MDLSKINRNLVAGSTPPLFERLPDSLFSPLASMNKQSYWAILCSLHQHFFGPDAPLPPSNGYSVKEITQKIEEELVLQSSWQREEEETTETPLSVRAVGVFNRLHESGWFRRDRHGIDRRVSMTPAVGQFLSQLIVFAETGPIYVSGKIRSIELNLKAVYEGGDGDSLVEAAEQARNLLDYVRNTGTNIRDLMSDLSLEETTAQYVRRFFGDYIQQVFIGDYKELRTREHPLARSPQILQWVEELHDSEDHRRRLIDWYEIKRYSGDKDRAKRIFERDINRLLDIRRINEYLDRLDDEIRRANRRALAFLDYHIRSLRPIDGVVDAAIQRVLSLESEPTYVPFPPGHLVGPKFLAEPRRHEPRKAPLSLRPHIPSDEELARARLKVKARESRLMTPPKLAEYVVRHLAGKSSVASNDLDISDIPTIRAYQTLLTLSTAFSSGSKMLQRNALTSARGFNVTKTGQIEISSKLISGIPFDIEPRRKVHKKEAGT